MVFAYSMSRMRIRNQSLNSVVDAKQERRRVSEEMYAIFASCSRSDLFVKDNGLSEVVNF